MSLYLIVGGASSIGQAVATLLTESGHQVKTCARNTQKISPDFILDASDFQAVDAMFQSLQGLDGVVNCSGSLLLKPAHLTTEQDWNTTINACLTSSFAVVRSAGRHMKQGGSVVLLGSAAANIGLVNHEAISAAKAGIKGLALSAAATYAHQGLRFNVVEPGLTMTPLTQALWSNDMLKQGSIAMHPLGRLGTPLDIARAIVFFLAPENNWITGQCLAVDGGLASIKPKMKS